MEFRLRANLSRRSAIVIARHLAAGLLIVGVLARFDICTVGVLWRQHTRCFTHLVGGHQRHDRLSRLILHGGRMNLINHAGIGCYGHGLARRSLIDRHACIRAEGLRERAMSRCHGGHLL